LYKSANLDQAAAYQDAIPHIPDLPVSPETIVQQVDSISSTLDVFGESFACLGEVMAVVKGISTVGISYIIERHLPYFVHRFILLQKPR
jgi:hypothetical protein